MVPPVPQRVLDLFTGQRRDCNRSVSDHFPKILQCKIFAEAAAAAVRVLGPQSSCSVGVFVDEKQRKMIEEGFFCTGMRITARVRDVIQQAEDVTGVTSETLSGYHQVSGSA